MALITILPHPDLCPEGKSFELRKGKSLCEGMLAAGIALEHACEMVAACATCHVYLRAGADSVAEPDDEENDQLDHAWGLEAQSRLSCCVKAGAEDLTVEIPLHTRNHARER